MNIWVDIAHIPQYNFYRRLIEKLASEGHTVYVTVLNRGKLAKIVQKEMGQRTNVIINVVGRHRSKRWSAILEANLVRNVQLLRWAAGKHIDVGFSNGYQLAFIGFLKHFPSYSFDDDPDTIDYRPKLWFNQETNYCLYRYEGRLSAKAHILPVLKEWAYLSPTYFHADKSVLQEYGLQPKEYIFVREVSVGTVNYAGQDYGAVLDRTELLPKDKKVVLSLECKEKRDLYPADWILLREPVKDIHSLIYYSAALVSSGDSMAREAALLGVPSYYLGSRYGMPANKAATELAGLQNSQTQPLETWLDGIKGNADEQMIRQDQLRNTLRERMMDINAYMYSKVNSRS